MRLPESETVSISFPVPLIAVSPGDCFDSCCGSEGDGAEDTRMFLIDLFGWFELMACLLDDRVLFPFPEL